VTAGSMGAGSLTAPRASSGGYGGGYGNTWGYVRR